MKKVKVATIVIMVIAMVYVIVLSTIGAPVQTKVVILLSDDSSSMTELPFNVSFWWSLIFFPIYLLACVYIFNQTKIAGEEPGTSKGGIKEKYHVRGINFMVNVLYLFLSLGTCFIGMVGGFFSDIAANTFGPLSFITINIQLFLICHIIVGPAVEFLMMLCKDISYEYESYSEAYEARALAYVKNGAIKSLPNLIAATAAFMVRFALEGVIKIFKKVANTKIKIQTS